MSLGKNGGSLENSDEEVQQAKLKDSHSSAYSFVKKGSSINLINRYKSQNKASTVNSGSNYDDKTDLFSQISIDVLESLKTWEELTTSWMKAADSFCRLKDNEVRSGPCLQLAQTILLALVKVRVKDEFSVKPRSMIRIFEAWENVYDATIEACSQDSIQCCTFAIKLANRIRQKIACEKMDCLLLFIYSHIIRAQIEYFNYDILNDVFVGDFDLSGEGNVLDSFCKLLIEIRKHSVEMCFKNADKQAGIGLELMSKSVLNILEAATSLVSLMVKPAHILFVVGALSEFMSRCLALVMEKDCRVFCKSQTNVFALVRATLTTLKKHYSGPYDTSLLCQLQPVFINGLRLSRLRRFVISFWQQTFGRAGHLNVLDELSIALEQAKCASVNFGSEQEDFSVMNDSKMFISCDTNLDFSMNKNNDIVNKGNSEPDGDEVFSLQSSNQSPSKSAQPSVSKCRTLEHVKKENTEEYVVIDLPRADKKMQLTGHQKEKGMERRKSVDLAARSPPGYTDNSQENSSTMKAPAITSLVRKSGPEYNCIATPNVCVRSKNEDLLAGNTNESNDHVGNTGVGDSSVNRITMKDSVVPEDMQDDQAVKFDGLYLQGQTGTNSGESAIIFLDEHVTDMGQKILKETTLSIRCKTPEIAQSPLEGMSPKENADEAMRTPNSILKKCGRRATCPAIKFFSASAKKCKRVHFDASTLDDDDIYGPPRRKFFLRSKNSLFSGLPLCNRSEPPSLSKRPPILPTNKNPAAAVFPALVGSEELIPPQIYLKLAPAMSSLALRSLMKSRGVATVGDLACMSEQDIETFPFRDPKLSRFLGALEDHFRMKNMVSKEDAIELEKIMKRPLKSSANGLKEIHLQPKDKHEAVSSKTVQELRTIDVPEALGKTTSETSGNEASKALTKHSYVNPFQNGSKRFTPYSVKRLNNGETDHCSSEQSYLKSNRILPSFEIRQKTEKQGNSRSRFGFLNPFVRSQKPMNITGPITVATLEENDANSCIGSSSSSEHDNREEKFTIKSPLPNENIGSCESNGNINNMKPGEDDGHHDVDDSLRNAYRIFLKDSVVAALAGIYPMRTFSSEQLLSFSQACASFQMAVLSRHVLTLPLLQFSQENLSTFSEISSKGGKAVAVYCDHSKDDEVKELFEKIAKDENNRLDVLVNNAFSGGAAMEKNVGKKFFECQPSFWDEINGVGLRNVYICSVLASRMMILRRKGLIVNISSAAGIRYFFNVPYGVGKAAIDKMSADMAEELMDYKVAVVSLWPGIVKTEKSYDWLRSGMLSQLSKVPQAQLERMVKKGETPEFVGRGVACLACDVRIMRKTGCILLTGDLCNEYMFLDNDGKIPSNMRNVNAALDFFGFTAVAKVIPSFLKIPATFLHLSSNKFYKL
uniref:Non-specific serine/threonine protein kinase n=1 Tax=Elaeophora elaphi TaxID=1147741 RepID=A0A0R3RZR0_9BILA